MNNKGKNNLAFIDGQNLYWGTAKTNPKWRINLFKFRKYLAHKYNVKKAYYFLGFFNEKYQDLYDEIQEAGFILRFRKHNMVMLGKKKGNVDSDIIFDIMKRMYERELFDKVALISGDGDYRRLVDFLIKEGRFEKILFPNKKYSSSLYKNITRVHFDFLINIRHLIEK